MVSVERGNLGQLVKLGVGGQGTVFSAPRVRFNGAMEGVYKEYKPQVLPSIDFGTLEKMTAFLSTLSNPEGQQLVNCAAWPVNLVEHNGAPSGFVMPAVPTQFMLDIRLPSGRIDRRLAAAQFLLNDDRYIASIGLQRSIRDIYELILSCAQTLTFFHAKGVTVGDISAKNVLFSLGLCRSIYFIDCDSMVIDGRTVTTQVETPDWDIRAVSSEPLATVYTDRHKLGLLALRLLAGHQSTRNIQDCPPAVPSAVRSLISASLQTNPSARPAPSDWYSALAAAQPQPQPRHPQRSSAGQPRQRRVPLNHTWPRSTRPLRSTRRYTDRTHLMRGALRYS